MENKTRLTINRHVKNAIAILSESALEPHKEKNEAILQAIAILIKITYVEEPDDTNNGTDNIPF